MLIFCAVMNEKIVVIGARKKQDDRSFFVSTWGRTGFDVGAET